MAKKRFFWLILLITASLGCLEGQRGEGPRRRVANARTIELPGGSRVEFREFDSSSRGEQARYSIFLPPAYEKQEDRTFPVIYFLHGMNNDHTSWVVKRYGNLPEVIEGLIVKGDIREFVMVHPEGENTLYTDTLDGTKKNERFIYKDLIEEIEGNFRVRKERSGRALAGTSMGGYGALKIAMKHPDLYSSVAGGSPIILLGKDPSKQILASSARRVQYFGRLFEPVFGLPFDHDHWMANSIEELAQTAKLDNLNIYFVYGTADRYQDVFPIEQGIRRLDDILTQRGIPHTLKVYQGEPHGWELIRGHIEEILEFLTQTF